MAGYQAFVSTSLNNNHFISPPKSSPRSVTNSTPEVTYVVGSLPTSVLQLFKQLTALAHRNQCLGPSSPFPGLCASWRVCRAPWCTIRSGAWRLVEGMTCLTTVCKRVPYLPWLGGVAPWLLLAAWTQAAMARVNVKCEYHITICLFITVR